MCRAIEVFCGFRVANGCPRKESLPYPHMRHMQTTGAVYLSESVRKQKYTGARCWRATRRPPGLYARCLPTNGGIFSVPGSKKRASMMRWSSRTLGMLRASPWRSTPGSHSRTLSLLTTKRWNGSRFRSSGCRLFLDIREDQMKHDEQEVQGDHPGSL